MSNFTHEDFRKVAIEVAGYISLKGGLALEKGWDCSQDYMWEAKRSYVDQVYRRFMRVVKIAGNEKIEWKGKSELIINMEHPNTLEKREGDRPFFYSDSKHPLNDAGQLRGVFDLFISDYKPPDNNDDLEDHLQVLQNYYSEIGLHINSVPPSIPQRIDFAMIRATGLALEKVGHLKQSAIKSIDRTDISSDKIRKIWEPMNEKIELVLNSVKPRETLSQRGKISIYQKAWKKCYPEEKPPSRSKFQEYIKSRKEG